MKTASVLLLLLSILSVTAQAQYIQPSQPQYAGIRSHEFEGVVSSQRTPVWCWAACIQMVLNYYQIDITQEDVARRTFGRDWYGNPPAIGGSASVISQNLNNWNVDRRGQNYVVRSSVFRGSPDAGTIIEHLSQGKPIILGYGPNADSGHVVVVTAVSYFYDQFRNPQITSVIVRDPYPDYWNIQTRGRREYCNGYLPDTVQWMWLVDVARY